MKSDIEIARSIELKKVKQVAESIGIPRDEVENYGRYIAKIPEQLIDEEKVKKSKRVQPASTSTQNPAQYDNRPYRVSAAALPIPEPEMFPPLEE